MQPRSSASTALAISFAQGAGLFVPYVTAWRALFGRANVRAGDTVLIHGASGGVGGAATQFAVAVGATVIGTAGSDDGLAVVRAQGARHAINHRAAGYLDVITAATEGRGPDVILEMLANVNLDHDLTVVAQHGRIVVIGNRGRVEIDARKIMTKDVSVFGLALWGIAADEIRRAHEAIVAGLESGALNPVVGTEMPLKDAARRSSTGDGARRPRKNRADSVIPARVPARQDADPGKLSPPARIASGEFFVDDRLEVLERHRADQSATVDIERRRRVHAHLFTELGVVPDRRGPFAGVEALIERGAVQSDGSSGLLERRYSSARWLANIASCISQYLL